MSQPLPIRQRRARFDGDYNVRAAQGDSSGRGRLEGVASRVGVLDSYNTVVAPGFFDGVIPDFLQNGSLLLGHDYRSAPIGYPMEAEMRGRDLWIASEYHSTPNAQEARTIAQERMTAGKRVGLSIGFDVETYAYFVSGRSMIDAIEKTGGDLSAFDVDAIRAEEDWVWLLTKCGRLYEYSQVPFPSNDQANATDVRSGGGEANAARVATATKADVDRLLARANALDLPKLPGGAALLERAKRIA